MPPRNPTERSPAALRIALGLLLSLGLALPVSAALKTVKKGKSTLLDGSQFQGDLAKEFKFFKAKCSQCHDLHRPTYALVKGKTPLSGDNFDKMGIKKYVVKMMRKPNSGISKPDAKRIIKFLLAAQKLNKGG